MTMAGKKPRNCWIDHYDSKGAKTTGKETEKPKDDASTSWEVAGKTQDKRTKGKNTDDDDD